MTEDERTRIALFRMGVLGPLVSARLEHGDRSAYYREAAARTWELPSGRRLKVSPRTVEAWHHAYQRGGLEALKPKPRSDAGRSRAIGEELGEAILSLKREKLRRSVRRIIKILERGGLVRRGELARSTVHRFLKAHDLSERPSRHGEKERRAFRHPFPGDLWMGDVFHSRQALSPEGKPKKAYLHLFIDSATRLVPHGAFHLGEKAHDFEAVLRQAFMKHGRPRALYVDCGSAQRAGSLKIICAELGVRLLHTQAYDPQAKAAIERIGRTFREELEDELPDHPLPLPELNTYLWSWLSVEYHGREHSGTGRAPMEHWLSGLEHVRPLPPGAKLEEIFLHRRHTRVRRDSTVRFAGGFLEVRGELVGQRVELRYDPTDGQVPVRVFQEGRHVCDARVLDVVANSARPRRRLKKAPKTPPPSSGLSPLDQMKQERARLARPPRDDRNDRKEN